MAKILFYIPYPNKNRTKKKSERKKENKKSTNLFEIIRFAFIAAVSS